MESSESGRSEHHSSDEYVDHKKEAESDRAREEEVNKCTMSEEFVWVKAKDSTGENPAFLLAEDDEHYLIKWAVNKQKEWLYKDENIIIKDSERTGGRRRRAAATAPAEKPATKRSSAKKKTEPASKPAAKKKAEPKKAAAKKKATTARRKATDSADNIKGGGSTDDSKEEGKTPEFATTTGIDHSNDKSQRLPRALLEIADRNNPGMKDCTRAHLEWQWDCTNCKCPNQSLLNLCWGCGMRRKSDRQKKSNGGTTSIKQVEWGADRGSRDHYSLVVPEWHRRVSDEHSDRDIKKLQELASKILAEVKNCSNPSNEDETAAFKRRPEEVEDDSGYFKGVLDADLVQQHFTNQCPPGLTIKKRSDEKGVAFVNLKTFTCDTHWDDFPGFLLVLSGKKHIFLAHPSVAKSLTEDETRSKYYLENPFEMELEGWQKIEAGPGDGVVIPPEWLHCIQSEPGTVGVSLKFECFQGSSQKLGQVGLAEERQESAGDDATNAMALCSDGEASNEGQSKSPTISSTVDLHGTCSADAARTVPKQGRSRRKRLSHAMSDVDRYKEDQDASLAVAETQSEGDKTPAAKSCPVGSLSFLQSDGSSTQSPAHLVYRIPKKRKKVADDRAEKQGAMEGHTKGGSRTRKVLKGQALAAETINGWSGSQPPASYAVSTRESAIKASTMSNQRTPQNGSQQYSYPCEPRGRLFGTTLSSTSTCIPRAAMRNPPIISSGTKPTPIRPLSRWDTQDGAVNKFPPPNVHRQRPIKVAGTPSKYQLSNQDPQVDATKQWLRPIDLKNRPITGSGTSNKGARFPDPRNAGTILGSRTASGHLDIQDSQVGAAFSTRPSLSDLPKKGTFKRYGTCSDSNHGSDRNSLKQSRQVRHDDSPFSLSFFREKCFRMEAQTAHEPLVSEDLFRATRKGNEETKPAPRVPTGVSIDDHAGNASKPIPGVPTVATISGHEENASKPTPGVIMSDTTSLRSLLALVNGKASGIQSCATAMMKHYDRSNDVAVVEWRNALHNSRRDQLLPLLYVANEVLQSSKHSRGNKFLEAFSPMLGKSLIFICQHSDARTVEKILRTVRVWGDRRVFAGWYINDLLKGLEPYRNN